MTSHRGGSGKTALATGLATRLSLHHHKRVLVLDYSPDGAAAYLLMGDGQQIKPLELINPNFLPLEVASECEARVVWAPGLIRSAQFWDLVRTTAVAQGMDLVIVDLPVTGGNELSEALRHAWLVVVAVPCDGPAFRSLGPLLETLNEERSRPNRSFQVRAVMTMTGVPNPERQALETFERRYLRPMLMKSDLPFDGELRRTMALGRAPSGRQSLPGSAESAMCVIADEIVAMANPQDALLTPGGG
jgi:cellulose biosynthesis protein BcsQ